MKKQATIVLVAIAFSFSMALAAAAVPLAGASGGPRGGWRSRFLASAKKCGNDPAGCYGAAGSATSCCSGECVDTASDPSNCGKCGKLCKFTESCCGGKCVDLRFDKKNCGACFNKCKKSCLYGLCDYA